MIARLNRPSTKASGNMLKSLSVNRGLMTTRKQTCVRSRSVDSTPRETSVSRRALLSSTATLTGWLWAMTPAALALLPDDDDADLLSKAKAKRKQRIQEELETEKKFVEIEKSKTDAKRLTQLVQNAVYNLARSGSQLDSENLDKVSELLQQKWVKDFETAAASLSLDKPEAETNAEQIVSEIASLQTTAEKGDLNGSKKQFVATVSTLQEWIERVGLAPSLKGL